LGEPFVDGLLQFGSTMEGASADPPFRNQGKEPFDLIQSRTAGRGEVKVEAPPAFRLEPALRFGALMRTVVVHDQVHFLLRYRPTMSRTLASKWGSLDSLKRSTRWGCTWCRCQTRCTIVGQQ
jgi:hypothetical protein